MITEERNDIERCALVTMKREAHASIMDMPLEELIFLQYVFKERQFKKAKDVGDFVDFVSNCKRLLSEDGANELDEFITSRIDEWLSAEMNKKIKEEFTRILKEAWKINAKKEREKYGD